MDWTDDQLNELLLALSREGFEMPYAAHVRDYFPADGPHSDAGRQAEALAALRSADTEAERQNRDALRSALAGRTGA